MKILIAYYSRTGNTEKIAKAIKEEFIAHGHSVDVETIKPQKEHSFMVRLFIRIFRGECAIQPLEIKDVSKYDALCIGSPNWTRFSLPIAKYLKEVEGLEHKKTGFFSATFLPPIIGKYLFSTYLFDLKFFKIIEEKGGRVVDSILLSSAFKKWGLLSDYGRKILKNFCQKVETPITFLREYTLKGKETEENRLIITALLVFNLFFLFFQFLTVAIGKTVFNWNQFFVFLVIGFISYFFIVTVTETKKGIYFGKYVIVGVAITSWTLGVLFLGLPAEPLVIFGYLFFLTATFFFRNVGLVIFAAFFALFNYLFLYFKYPLAGALDLFSGIAVLILNAIIISFVTENFRKHFLKLLDAQDEAEEARAILEIKIAAKIHELKELAEDLEKKVENRTAELKGKILELERFQKLAVGRELKMIELKKEIEKLREKK